MNNKIEHCYYCGGEMETFSSYEEDSMCVGKFTIEDIEYQMCKKCGSVSLPHLLMIAIEDKENQLIQERLFKRLSTIEDINGQYIEDKELAGLLKISLRSLRLNKSLNMHLLNNMIYHINLFGRKYYLRESAEKFLKDKDGRFLLS